MNVLCVVAHSDDELLGCGATIRKLRNAGHQVFTCVLCAPVDARHARPDLERLRYVSEQAEQIIGVSDSLKYEFRNIQFNVVPHLEMVNAIEKAIIKFRPSWLFTHHPGDLNIDHRICYETTMAAAALPQRLSTDLPPTLLERIYLFEVLSSTDWAGSLGIAFQPNAWFDVRDTFDQKIRALEAFEGALKPFPHSRSKENLRHLAHLRGGQVGIELAEAFTIVRELNL